MTYYNRNRSELTVPFRLTCCGRFQLAALLLTFSAHLFAQSPTIALTISSETAPPGGYAQLKVSLASPALVSNASVSMTLNPTIFGPISNVAAFSATGDQIGYAHVEGQQVTASFSSASAGLGQLPGLPIFVVTVPVLATASLGATSLVTVDPTQSPWQDQQGNAYTITVNPGTFTVGGSLSIQSVTPGGGLLPAGTVIRIDGTGFNPTATVTIDGVSVASTQFVSAQQMRVTLGGSTELTGKHVHVQTATGPQSAYFCSLSSAPANVTSTVFPLLPQTTYSDVTWDHPITARITESVALLNQTVSPVVVTFFFTSSSGMVTVAPSISIPAGELYLLDSKTFGSGLGTLAMLSSAPIRMLEYKVITPLSVTPIPEYSVFPPGTLNVTNALPQPLASPSGATWSWQIGTTAPLPVTTVVSGNLPFTATVSSTPWLSVSADVENRTLTLTPHVSGLAVGVYAGSVLLRTVLPASLSALTVPDVLLLVIIQVSASPLITAFGDTRFTATSGATTPVTGAISTGSNGNPAQFSVSVNTGSIGWLTAMPLSGTTPGSIEVVANPAGLSTGTYSGSVVIKGPANSVTVPVTFVIAPAANGGPVPLSANPSSLSFALAAGTAAPQAAQLVSVQPTLNFNISVQTQSGGSWLSASFVGAVSVTASAVGLTPGTYLGVITLTSATNGSVQIPVTLVVLTPASPLIITPASVAVSIQAGQQNTRAFHIDSSSSTLYHLTTFTPGSEQWINQELVSSPFTPATVTLTFAATQPGTHYGSVTFTSGSGSVTVPIVLTVTASPVLPPILASVVSAASGTPSAISPGEIISLYGTGIGSTPAGLTLDADGKVATELNGTQVLIDNIPAPLIYASSGQVNAIVPYEVGSSGNATVQVTVAGIPSQTWSVPVAEAMPSIFTIGATGAGQAAVLNQDNSINSPSNPAATGTVIQIFATGGGQTSPASFTGGISDAANVSLLPATVNIGSRDAVVAYHGAAPGEISGLLQVNAVVPAGLPTGSVDLLLTIGGRQSQRGVTVAVK
jgi:uncharacterized protein (TIGR03437 family)